MMGAVLIVCGVASMLLGVLMLSGWVGGKSTWFDSAVFDRRGGSKTDRMFLYLYFLAMVVVPLLAGGILIAYGLSKLL